MNISSNDLRAAIAVANKKASSSEKKSVAKVGSFGDFNKEHTIISEKVKAIGNTDVYCKNGVATLKSAISSGTYNCSNEEIAEQMIKQSLFNSLATIL